MIDDLARASGHYELIVFTAAIVVAFVIIRYHT